MKFKLKDESAGAIEIVQGPFVARFEPGQVVEIENPRFAAHLQGIDRLEVVEEGEAGGPGPGAGEGQSQGSGDQSTNGNQAATTAEIPPEGGTTNESQDPPDPPPATQGAKPAGRKPKAE